MNDTVALEACEVSWRVDDVDVVSDISTRIREHRTTMIVGLNGSGKTTLLHLLAGLRRPTVGTVRLQGQDIRTIPSRVRARTVALLEQVPRTTVDLDVVDVVGLGRIPHSGRWRRRPRRDPVVVRMMEATQVRHLADRPWSSLSGGEKQRVQLARALAQEPSILLLDEPTNHLDLRHQIDLLTRVRDLAPTTVAVIHDLDLAAAFADDLIVMDHGRLALQGPAQEILTDSVVRQHFGVLGHVRHADRIRFDWTGLDHERHP